MDTGIKRIRKKVPGPRPGPAELTGIYATRAELTTAVIVMEKEGIVPKDIAEVVGVSTSTVHDMLRRHREEQENERAKRVKQLISKPWVKWYPPQDDEVREFPNREDEV
jgi:DNA-binding MarR family transcriptional regulator